MLLAARMCENCVVNDPCRTTSEDWFVHNVGNALAVRNEEKGGALYPLEPRESPFAEFGVNFRVLWPGDPNALYHSEGVQRSGLGPGEAVPV